MVKRLRLNDKSVRECEPEVGRDYQVFDTEVRGFSIRILRSGNRSFSLDYRFAGAQRRMAIGRWPEWTVTAARERARELRRVIDEGGDPLGARDDLREAPRFSDMIDRYLAEHVPHLGGISDLTVITNAPRIAELVAGNRANRVFLLGGAYNAEVGENLGPLVIEQIGRFRASVAVLTVGAIGSEGIMDYDLAEAEVARAMISRADRVFVLADSSKFERRAVFDVAPLSAIARLYTDSAPSVAMTDRLQEAGVEIRIE